MSKDCEKRCPNSEKNAEKPLSLLLWQIATANVELDEILHFTRSCTSGHTYIATVAFLPGALM